MRAVATPHRLVEALQGMPYKLLRAAPDSPQQILHHARARASRDKSSFPVQPGGVWEQGPWGGAMGVACLFCR